MSDELPEDLRQIITAQTQTNLPTLRKLPVLPKIGASFSGKSLPNQILREPRPSTSAGLDGSGNVVLPLDAHDGKLSTTRKAQMNSTFHFDYSFIPDHEVLRSDQSTAHSGNHLVPKALTTLSDFDRTFVIRHEAPMPCDDSISLLNLKLAPIPATLPDIAGLQDAIDNLSHRRVEGILDACRLYDRELRGYLSVPSIIKCIGEVVVSVHSPTSPWRLFLHSLAPQGEFIEYVPLLELIKNSKQPEFDEETIPELLSPRNLGQAEFSFKPSTGQENRERCRAQVMMEIEVLLMRNPDLDLERLKTATTHKTIDVSEFDMLLELYGLEEPFRPFYQRLVSCFLTQDNKIHFSALVGCLALVRPPLQKAAQPIPSAPWNKTPLAPIATKRNQQSTS